MTVEEVRRLDELRNKEELTEEEEGELLRLVALEKETDGVTLPEEGEKKDDEEIADVSD